MADAVAFARELADDAAGLAASDSGRKQIILTAFAGVATAILARAWQEVTA